MRLSVAQRKSLEDATTEYERWAPLADSYLDSRGISTETVASCRLGVVADPRPGHEHMLGRLAIPYLTRAGVVAIRFRCLEEHNCKDVGCPKYLSETGRDARLYNVEALFHDTPTLCIAEGELDTVVLSYEVGMPTVGVPGVSAWQPHFTRLFAGHQRVLVFGDGDKAGREFAKRVTSELGPSSVAVAMPDGMDVTDLYVAEGPVSILERCS